MHTLHPNANMIYQFDAICLDLIGRDLLPLLSRHLPGEDTDVSLSDVVCLDDSVDLPRWSPIDLDLSDSLTTPDEDEATPASEPPREAPSVKKPPRRITRHRHAHEHQHGQQAQPMRRLRSHGGASVLSLKSSEERSPALQSMSAQPPVAVSRPSASLRSRTGSNASSSTILSVAPPDLYRLRSSPLASASASVPHPKGQLQPHAALSVTSLPAISPRWAKLTTWVAGASTSVLQTLGWQRASKSGDSTGSDVPACASASTSASASSLAELAHPGARAGISVTLSHPHRKKQKTAHGSSAHAASTPESVARRTRAAAARAY